jgi:GAF domain-containing protein
MTASELPADERLRIISETTRSFAEVATDPQRLFDTVARRVAETIGGYCVILLVSDDGLELIPAAIFDPDPVALALAREALAEPLILAAQPIARGVLETGQPLVAPVLDIEELRPPRTTPRYYEFVRDIGLHSMLIVALRVQGRSLGVLVLARHGAASAPYGDIDLSLECGACDARLHAGRVPPASRRGLIRSCRPR